MAAICKRRSWQSLNPWGYYGFNRLGKSALFGKGLARQRVLLLDQAGTFWGTTTQANGWQ